MSINVTGVAKSSGKECVAWLLGTDADIVVCTGTDGKKATPLAEARFLTQLQAVYFFPPSHNLDYHYRCLFLGDSPGDMWSSARFRNHGDPSLRL